MADPPPLGSIDLPALAVVEGVSWVDRPEALDALADLHVWTEETVLKRFHYRRPGLWVLGVRVLRADPPPRVEVTPARLGCKSWVPLETSFSTAGLVPTIDEPTLADRLARVRSISSQEAS
jgi:hypothetical protein